MQEAKQKNVEEITRIRARVGQLIDVCRARAHIDTEAKKKWQEIEQARLLEQEESMKLIIALQEQEEREAEKRRLEIEKVTGPDCSICMEKIMSQDYLPLDRCGHLYHPRCIREYLKNEVLCGITRFID